MLVLEEGANERLSASFDPVDTPNKAHVWLSEDPQVATVDETGLVIGISMGETTIIVKALDGGDTDTCYVTVTERSMPKSFAYGDTIHFINEWSSDKYGAHCLNYFIARGGIQSVNGDLGTMMEGTLRIVIHRALIHIE